jgi:hypothetical protein
MRDKTDTTETYYAEMEAARKEAEESYFEARPQLRLTITEVNLFRAGFERGFKGQWDARHAERDELRARKTS